MCRLWKLWDDLHPALAQRARRSGVWQCRLIGLQVKVDCALSKRFAAAETSAQHLATLGSAVVKLQPRQFVRLGALGRLSNVQQLRPAQVQEEGKDSGKMGERG